jgi:hypothetical protein
VDERPEGNHVTGKLIRPGGPVVARLVRAPNTPFPRLLGRAVRAAFRAPSFALVLGGSILLSRAGWGLAVLLILRAVLEDGFALGVAIGLGVSAALFSGLVELALWAGAIPVLAARMRGAEASAWGPVFTRGVELLFAPMLGVGVFRVAAWLLFQLASMGTAGAFLVALVAEPASVGLFLPVFFLLVAGDLLWRVLAWIAVARVGACKEGLVPSLFGGLRQLARRPAAHLLTFFGVNFALSIGGGGTAFIVLAGLGGASPLGAILVALSASLVAGMVLLVAMSVYTALTLDAALPSRHPEPAG